jgi:hypothetical protein
MWEAPAMLHDVPMQLAFNAALPQHEGLSERSQDDPNQLQSVANCVMLWCTLMAV